MLMYLLLAGGAAALAFKLGQDTGREPDGYGDDSVWDGELPLPLPVPEGEPVPSGPLVAGDGTQVLGSQCEYDKPTKAFVHTDVPIGPGAGRIIIPVMNAYAGCSTPLDCILCVRLSGAQGFAYPAGAVVSDAIKPSSRGFEFTLRIVGNADGTPKVVQVTKGKKKACTAGSWTEPVDATDIRRIKGVTVDGMAGVQIEFNTGKYTKLASVWLDASS